MAPRNSRCPELSQVWNIIPFWILIKTPFFGHFDRTPRTNVDYVTNQSVTYFFQLQEKKNGVTHPPLLERYCNNVAHDFTQLRRNVRKFLTIIITSTYNIYIRRGEAFSVRQVTMPARHDERTPATNHNAATGERGSYNECPCGGGGLFSKLLQSREELTISPET